MKLRLFILAFCIGTLCAEDSREEAFSRIYKDKMWGCNAEGEGTSGIGSKEETTGQYRQFLQDFFVANEIKSVVDVGCGDWEFSQLIDWRNIHYVGYDVVSSVIKRNQSKYIADHIQFIHADAINEDLPSADLLICKDVLMHLSKHDILAFIPQLKKYKYCLITNDVEPASNSNGDIQPGAYWTVDLTQAPFLLEGEKVLTFQSANTIKQVLLINNLLSAMHYTFFNARESAFNQIYEHRIWGSNSDGSPSSGGGSKEETTRPYRQFLQDFIDLFEIKSVVDVGCGDWEFSRLINWRNIRYVGYDVVSSVIKRNQAKYTADHIQFIHADAINEDLPSTDLLICKDVLQHLSNSDILAFLPQLKKFKYCLLTNDVDPQSLTSSNPDIPSGGYRPVDLTQAPFFLHGEKVLTFDSYNRKQVLLLKN